MKTTLKDRSSERGSASVKFVIVAMVIAVIANAGINYVPVAYDAESFKTEMNKAVVQGLALPGKLNPVENIRARIQKAATINQIPADAVIDVTMKGNAIAAHVSYTQPVSILPFGIFKYNYVFNETVTPTGFLLK